VVVGAGAANPSASRALVAAPSLVGLLASPDASAGGPWPVDLTLAGRGAQPKVGYNGKEVDQGVARKAQQEPEGEMEGTETAAAAEAP